MHGLMPPYTQPMCQTAWKMRINEKFRTTMGCIRFTWLRRVANTNAAKTICSFEIFIIGENLFDHHAST